MFVIFFICLHYLFPWCLWFLSYASKICLSLACQNSYASSFADLRWSTSLAGCDVNLDNLAKRLVDSCDPFGRPGLNYPPLSVEFGRLLGVNESHTGIIGFLSGLILFLITIFLVRSFIPTGVKQDLITSSVLLSLPFQLALERCNIDIIIFIFLFLLSCLFSLNSLLVAPLVVFLGWLTVGIKLYPLAGIFIWSCWFIYFKLKPSFNHLLLLVGSFLPLHQIYHWYLEAGKTVPQPHSGILSHSFLVKIPPDRIQAFFPSFGQSLQLPIEYLLTFISLLAILLPFIFLLLNSNLSFSSFISSHSKSSVSYNSSLYVCSLSGFVWLACYFLSGSFDYRFIFAYPLLFCLLSIGIKCSDRFPHSSFQDQLYCCCLLTSILYMYLPYLSIYIDNPLSDFLSLFADIVLLPLFVGSMLFVLCNFNNLFSFADSSRSQSF